jgi:hypothetical protein
VESEKLYTRSGMVWVDFRGSSAAGSHTLTVESQDPLMRMSTGQYRLQRGIDLLDVEHQASVEIASSCLPSTRHCPVSKFHSLTRLSRPPVYATLEVDPKVAARTAAGCENLSPVSTVIDSSMYSRCGRSGRVGQVMQRDALKMISLLYLLPIVIHVIPAGYKELLRVW